MWRSPASCKYAWHLTCPPKQQPLSTSPLVHPQRCENTNTNTNGKIIAWSMYSAMKVMKEVWQACRIVSPTTLPSSLAVGSRRSSPAPHPHSVLGSRRRCITTSRQLPTLALVHTICHRFRRHLHHRSITGPSITTATARLRRHHHHCNKALSVSGSYRGSTTTSHQFLWPSSTLPPPINPCRCSRRT